MELKEREQTFVFTDVPERPVPSLLRNFSAPVKLNYRYSKQDLLRLMTQDDDGFCRWDAAQQLGILCIQENRADPQQVPSALIEAFAPLLGDTQLDPALVALMLDLPSEAYLGEQQKIVDVEGNHRARRAVQRQLAQALEEQLRTVYLRCREALTDLADIVSGQAVALRSLKNRTLSYLMLLERADYPAWALDQFDRGGNMTDVLSAMSCLVHSEIGDIAKEKRRVLDTFYANWQHESLVVNQWLSVQAADPTSGVLPRVQALLQSPAFDIRNPNKVRSVISVFANQNMVHFHSPDGSGYAFLGDQVLLLNRQNPQIAARLLTPLTKWRRFDSGRQVLMKAQLVRIAAEPQLSKDVYEVVNKSLVE